LVCKRVRISGTLRWGDTKSGSLWQGEPD
jgi:hypothetical protein